MLADGNQTLSFKVAGTERLNTGTIDNTWSGGCVGLYRASNSTTATLQWDDFKCGYDENGDGDIADVDDYVYADYDFDDPGGGVTWQEITLSHDDNGNLTADGLFKYQYDAWNRLVGAWYNDGNMDDSDERVATYEYDALFRRIEKTVGNQGTGVVYGSDGSGDITGIEAGHPLTRRVGPCPTFAARTPRGARRGVSRASRHEHYFWGGMGVSPVNWRLIETTNHAESAGDYSYSDADVLNQFVYRLGGVGVSPAGYIDEPLVYDRNEDPNEDDSCLDVDGGEDAEANDDERMCYVQDRNWNVVALVATDDGAGGGGAGSVIERYVYTPYGECTVLQGTIGSTPGFLRNVNFTSSVGNPFLGQALPSGARSVIWRPGRDAPSPIDYNVPNVISDTPEPLSPWQWERIPFDDCHCNPPCNPKVIKVSIEIPRTAEEIVEGTACDKNSVRAKLDQRIQQEKDRLAPGTCVGHCWSVLILFYGNSPVPAPWLWGTPICVPWPLNLRDCVSAVALLGSTIYSGDELTGGSETGYVQCSAEVSVQRSCECTATVLP